MSNKSTNIDTAAIITMLEASGKLTPEQQGQLDALKAKAEALAAKRQIEAGEQTAQAIATGTAAAVNLAAKPAKAASRFLGGFFSSLA